MLLVACLRYVIPNRFLLFHLVYHMLVFSGRLSVLTPLQTACVCVCAFVLCVPFRGIDLLMAIRKFYLRLPCNQRLIVAKPQNPSSNSMSKKAKTMYARAKCWKGGKRKHPRIFCRCRPPQRPSAKVAPSGRGRIYRCLKNHVHLEDVLENLSEPPLLLILDGITDPHNLGACLRTADAMGVCRHRTERQKRGNERHHQQSRQRRGGNRPYITVTNLATCASERIRHLDHQHRYGRQRRPLPLRSARQRGMGDGQRGDGMRRLTREHCDMLVSIPMFGTVESMNVSVSAGMVLSEACGSAY